MSKYRLVYKRGKLVLQVSYVGYVASGHEDVEACTFWRNAKVEDLSSKLMKTIEEL